MKTKVCKKPGCGRLALEGKDFCEKHIELQNQQKKIFTRRGKSSQWHHLYQSKAWRDRSKAFLAKYPFCCICGKPSQIADHIVPHRGNLDLFYDDNNLQPLCWSCHSRKTMSENNNFNKKGETK